MDKVLSRDIKYRDKGKVGRQDGDNGCPLRRGKQAKFRRWWTGERKKGEGF